MQEEHRATQEVHVPVIDARPAFRQRPSLEILREPATQVRDWVEALRPSVQLLQTSSRVNSIRESQDPFSDMPGLEEMDPAEEGVWMNEIIFDIDMLGLSGSRTAWCSGKAEKENQAPYKA
ncbi:hypothetical protein Hypma_009697 [Hypsizygus marmoreus]|uniref:Uncharacterized protein n=1 Tax=Hypsizygus marmoreus TaxID=39966 RepID=A0A369JM23_HYPMA|nr:hypothetical protein Hypma_009697 [Hypsizygus marmoreus]